MVKCALTACIVVMAASIAQAAAPWVRGYLGAFYNLLPLWRPGRLLAGTEDQARPWICPHGSTTHFAIPAQVAKTLSARTLAHSEGSRSAR